MLLSWLFFLPKPKFRGLTSFLNSALVILSLLIFKNRKKKIGLNIQLRNRVMTISKWKKRSYIHERNDQNHIVKISLRKCTHHEGINQVGIISLKDKANIDVATRTIMITMMCHMNIENKAILIRKSM